MTTTTLGDFRDSHEPAIRAGDWVLNGVDDIPVLVVQTPDEAILATNTSCYFAGPYVTTTYKTCDGFASHEREQLTPVPYTEVTKLLKLRRAEPPKPTHYVDGDIEIMERNDCAIAEQLRAWEGILREGTSPEGYLGMADGMRQVADDIDPPETEGWKAITFYPSGARVDDGIGAHCAKSALNTAYGIYAEDYPGCLEACSHAVIIAPDGTITTLASGDWWTPSEARDDY